MSHSLSLIAVKAGVAGHIAQRRPEEAVSALRVIEQTSRAAMTEMRRTLGGAAHRRGRRPAAPGARARRPRPAGRSGTTGGRGS
ncbi:histidine kinase dimerization/phosphoacceptor domain-containing protein [Streptomyces gardneri]|uniref:histidine kinase dimerization/phosphoacceptor domain-containing protein n=1 Tax=Streptomyces gardneri TaxID=66892 RepID=UPI001E5040E4|nr:histidine kinase dimerization/phosphoacceptor domain-containing protein [Streptomyces gardneri]